MPIVKPPSVVQIAMEAFIAKHFINQPQRDHAARYVTGLMIAPNKTITGMTSEQPNAPDQSCLNRFMTEVDWDAQALNEERLSIELTDWCHAKGVLGTFTFDSFYASAKILNHINSLKNMDGTTRGYVGDLKFKQRKHVASRYASHSDGPLHVVSLTNSSEHRERVIGNGAAAPTAIQRATLDVDHKVRIVILWKYKNDAEPRKILVPNRIHWNAERIVETYRGRWTGTETFHRDGKQLCFFIGALGDFFRRDGEGQTRHTYMVFLAYSLLMRELDKTSVSGWASVKLTTIGESCRAMLRESVSAMIGWVFEQLGIDPNSHRDTNRRLGSVMQRLGLAAGK